MDVMANVRKIKTCDIKNFGKFADHFLIFVESITKGGTRIDFVFDSYSERSIKDSECKKRAKKLSY